MGLDVDVGRDCRIIDTCVRRRLKSFGRGEPFEQQRVKPNVKRGGGAGGSRFLALENLGGTSRRRRTVAPDRLWLRSFYRPNSSNFCAHPVQGTLSTWWWVISTNHCFRAYFAPLPSVWSLSHFSTSSRHFSASNAFAAAIAVSSESPVSSLRRSNQ